MTILSKDLSNDKLMSLSQEIEVLEEKLAKYNDLKTSYDNFKRELHEAMVESNIVKFTSPNGTQFTAVSPSVDKTELILAFNEEKFKQEHEDLYTKYVEQKEKFTKGRAGYLRITLPKNETEKIEGGN